MKLVRDDNLNLIIKKDYSYSFDAPEAGFYLIEIIAETKSWWQNFTGRRSFLKADYLSVAINEQIFPRQEGSKSRKDLFFSPLAWNGNKLKGLEKINIFIVQLKKGVNQFKFTVNHSPRLTNIRIFSIDRRDSDVDYRVLSGSRPQDGDRRTWISLALPQGIFNNLNISAAAGKYSKSRDDDDLKIIIDGQTQLNESKNSHQDWFWCGKILNGSIKEFKRDLSAGDSWHFLELWADRRPRLDFIKLFLIGGESENENLPESNVQYRNKDLKWWEDWRAIKKYQDRGPSGNRDYNRYDELIVKAVARWNKEFFDDVYPPDEPLDPNLVKAMIFQESIIGYDDQAPINIMSVGNPGDNTLDILNNQTEHPEYELRNGKIWTLDYKGQAQVNSVADSIYWGVRWLYHKAQETKADEREWLSWRKAVEKYGPHDGLYTDNVWSIYTEGVSHRETPVIKLWSVILLTVALVVFSYFFGADDFLQAATFDSIKPESQEMTTDIEIKTYVGQPSLFSAVIVRQKDWWEDLKVGRYTQGSVKWLEIDRPPYEQAILSVKFIKLKGFTEPFLEVYGYGHKGTGFFHLYQIKGDNLRLVLETRAVDYKNESHAYLENFMKYGHWNCDARFISGLLDSFYEDFNNDGVDDVKLSGREEMVCDVFRDDYQIGDDFTTEEEQMAEYGVEKIFLFDASKNTYQLDKVQPSGWHDDF